MLFLLQLLLSSCLSEDPKPEPTPLPANMVRIGNYLYKFDNDKVTIDGNGDITKANVEKALETVKGNTGHADQPYFKELYFIGTKAVTFQAFSGWNGTVLDMSATTNQDYYATSRNCKDMKNLVTLKFPKVMKQIGVQTFMGCNQITSITLPKIKNFFDKECFQGCAALTHVTFLDYASFGGNMFTGCMKLVEVIYCSTKPPKALDNYAEKNMFDPKIDKSKLKIYVRKNYRVDKFAEIDISFHDRKVDEDCTVDQDFKPTKDPTPSATPKPSQTATLVGSIYYSFLGSKIVLSGNGEIQKEKFQEAFDKSNKEIYINGQSIWKSIEVQGPGDFIVPESAFYNDSTYEFIYFYNTGTLSIMKNAFVNCFNLQKVVFNNKIIKVDDYGCKGLKNLYSITFSLDVDLGKFAFQDCKDLNFVKFDGKATFQNAAFLNCDGIKTVYYNNANPPTYYGDIFVSGQENNYTSVLNNIDVQVPNDYQGNSFLGKDVDPNAEEDAAAANINKPVPMSKYETNIIAITASVVAIIVVATTVLCVLLIVRAVKKNQ